jgi:glycine/D-amino acid oxidase-like deaminating enzyme
LDQLNAELPDESKVQIRPGTFVIRNAASGRLDDENFDAIRSALIAQNEPHQQCSPKDIPGYKPSQPSRAIEALYLPNEGSIDSTKLWLALQSSFLRKASNSLVDDSVVRINEKGGRIESLETSKGHIIEADRVMIAAGAFTGQLIPQLRGLADRVPLMMPGVGLSMLCHQPPQPIETIIRTPNRSASCGLHVLARDSRTAYIGATNNLYFMPQTEPMLGLVAFLAKNAMEQVNEDFYYTHLIKWQVGNRPVAIDGFPVIGRTSIANLWLMTGTYRDGLTCSPTLSRQMADELTDGPERCPAIFAPERPLIETRTTEESIQEMVVHFVSAGFENWMYLPRFFAEKQMESVIEARVRALYAQLETEYGLSPEVLFALIFSNPGEPYIELFRRYLRSVKVRPTVAKVTEPDRVRAGA